MKMKILRRCTAFFLILGVLLWACSVWTDRLAEDMADSVPGRNHTVAKISAEPENTVDLLILGDSESHTSMSPMELWGESGVSAYVCGQSGQRIQETYYMLKKALQTQSPKAVILETNVMFRDPGFFRNLQTCFAEPLRYYMPVFRYHSLWKMIFDGQKNTGDDYKGFMIRNAVDPCDGEEYMKETTERQEIPEFARIYMEKITELCRKNDISLVLMSAPSPKNYNYRKHNALQEYADAQGLPYIDLNLKTKEIGIDWKQDSYDKGDHLNVYGAQKVTAYMGKYLKENYDLPDHRGDPKYADWDQMEKKYREKLNL
mgnify:FL=1